MRLSKVHVFGIFFIVISLCMPVLTCAQEIGTGGSKIFSLIDCIEIALKNNPEIGIAREGLKMSESGLLVSYGGLLPRFSLSFATGHRYYGPSSVQYDAQGRPVQQQGFDYGDYSFSLSSDITLFDGGGNINRIRSSINSRNASREELKYRKYIITAMVIRSYYNLVRNQMLLTVQEEAVEQAEKSLEKTEALLEVGSATRADVLKARVRHSNTRLNVITARNAVLIAEEELSALLNMRKSREVRVDTSLTIELIEPDPVAEIQYAMQNRSDLKSLSFSIKSAKQSVSAAKSGWIPSLGASFGYYWNDRDMADNLNFFEEEYMWNVTGYMRWNIFDGFLTSNNVNNARANYRITEYNMEKAKLDAVKEIKQLILSINEARERISVATETVEQAMEDLRVAEERYRVGAGTMLEAIDAEVALTQAKADVIDAKCDYLISSADLYRATGRTIVDMKAMNR